MGGLAVPLLEGAALTLARRLGWGAVAAAGGAASRPGAGTGDDAVLKKIDEAEKSKTSPLATGGDQSNGVDVCKKCPPDCGYLVDRNWHMSEDSRDYQARITGFVPGTEWHFESCDFDGYKSYACLLLEAKAHYDQFFNPEGEPRTFFKYLGLPKMMKQARSQSAVVWRTPPSRLHWHFKQPISHRYFAKRFAAGPLPIETHLTP